MYNTSSPDGFLTLISGFLNKDKVFQLFNHCLVFNWFSWQASFVFVDARRRMLSTFEVWQSLRQNSSANSFLNSSTNGIASQFPMYKPHTTHNPCIRSDETSAQSKQYPRNLFYFRYIFNRLNSHSLGTYLEVFPLLMNVSSSSTCICKIVARLHRLNRIVWMFLLCYNSK